MKKQLFYIVFLVSVLFTSAQNLKTDKFEVYLLDYLISEVDIAKGMYMTKNKQFFYEGEIEVSYLETNTTRKYQFYFSTWDGAFKEFIVKDRELNELGPKFSFVDNDHIKYSTLTNKEIVKPLENSRNVDYGILSSMLVWLESATPEK